MSTIVLTSLYDTYDQATEAVQELEASGLPHGNISLIGHGTPDTIDIEETSATAEGAGTGAGLGAILGGGAGLLAGLGIMAIPGIGPVVAAGWFAATALGAAAGAGVGGAAGGVIGALTGVGVSSDSAHIYAEGVRRGGTLVTVRVEQGTAETVDAILKRHKSVDLSERERHYRADGWTAFDPSADPYRNVVIPPSDVGTEARIERAY